MWNVIILLQDLCHFTNTLWAAFHTKLVYEAFLFFKFVFVFLVENVLAKKLLQNIGETEIESLSKILQVLENNCKRTSSDSGWEC